MNTYNPFHKIAETGKKSHADLLAQKIQDMIISGELIPEKIFPNENVLCGQLGVSRSTLREAYKILEIKGYLVRSKSGTFIKRSNDIVCDGNFKAALEFSKKNEILEFVTFMEGEAAYLAAQRATEEQIMQIEKFKKLCEDNLDIPAALEEYNSKFHLAIRIASKNQPIISSLTAAYDRCMQNKSQIFSKNKNTEEIKNFINQHDKLFEAICNKDAVMARKIAAEHLNSECI